MRSFKLLVSLCCISTMFVVACGERNKKLDEKNQIHSADTFLQRFAQNQAQTMNEKPVSTLVQGYESQDPSSLRLPPDSITNNKFVKIKDEVRSQMDFCDTDNKCINDYSSKGLRRAEARENILYILNPEYLPGKKIIEKLSEMEEWRSAQLSETPWSDTYWPIYQGSLGVRYMSDNFFNFNNSQWQGYYNYIYAQPSLQEIARTMTTEQLATELSPAEKYDLIIGSYGTYINGLGVSANLDDQKRGLFTSQQWKEGRKYAKNGVIETWMGLCHGWAPASYMVERPRKAITVPVADPHSSAQITLFPSDLKGLATYTWAKSAPSVRFIGGRCNTPDPKTYPSGRIQEQDCFDVTPNIWHMAIVNELGRAKQSLVLDATYDYEVWNQPLYSYSYTYFNPLTLKTVNSIKDATVIAKGGKFSGDRFPEIQRSPKTETVVGIAMTIQYVVETSPSSRKEDSSQFDAVKSVSYYYDLELDKDGRMVGGEWYQNAHPDFLWTPNPKTKPKTPDELENWGTAEALNWNSQEKLNPFWSRIATSSASANAGGKTVNRIVEALIKRSRQ